MRTRSAFRALGVLFFGVLLSWQLYRSMGLLQVERMLWLAEGQANEMVRRGRVDGGILRHNLAQLQIAQRRHPSDPRVSLAIGSHYLLLDRPASAEHWYRLSIEAELRPESLLNLARSLLLQEKREQARAVVGRLLRLDPFRRTRLPAELAELMGS